MKKIYILILLLIPSTLLAHDVRYSVSQQNAYIIDIYYADGTKFAYESYEIYKDGEKTAYQVGRTDKSGKIAFLPDSPGKWEIKAFSDDGHGVTFNLDVEQGKEFKGNKLGFFERYARTVFGLGIILIIFSIINIFIRRKKDEEKNGKSN